jgi:hypothetical protein
MGIKAFHCRPNTHCCKINPWTTRRRGIRHGMARDFPVKKRDLRVMGEKVKSGG